MGVLKHATASQNCHMADFFFHNMSNLWTLCCTDISTLDGTSVVYVPGPSLRGPGFHSQNGKFCLSVLLYLLLHRFSLFLVLFCHVKS